MSSNPLRVVVSVSGGIADVDICPDGVTVVILDYDGLEENIADNLRHVRNRFSASGFDALVEAARRHVVEMIRGGQADGVIEACQMLDLEAIAEEAGIKPLNSVETARANQNAIVPILEISTAHISHETNDWISRAVEFSDLGIDYTRLIIYPKATYGWLVLVPQDDLEETLEGVPEDLQNLMRFAVERGAKWIMLDGDAPVVDGLPTFEW